MTKHLDPADQLTVQQLRTFFRVFELRSYSAAARSLDLSVAAVWEQVQSLQRQYGVELFAKVGRGITATPSGQQLYQVLLPILAGLDSSFELLHSERFSPTQPLTIVSGVRMMQEELAPAFRRFQRELYEEMQIAVETDNSAFTMAAAREGMGVGILAGVSGGVGGCKQERSMKKLALRKLSVSGNAVASCPLLCCDGSV